MKTSFYLILFSVLFFSSCTVKNDILDDYIEPEIIIENIADIPSELTALNEHQFSANFFNDIGEIKNNLITWESSDITVITIDANGLATAITGGTATITVIAKNDNPNSENATITKNVATIKVTTIAEVLTITNPIAFLSLEESYTFTKQYFNNNGVEDNNISLEWSSSEAAIATISNSGLVTPIKIGITNITVKTTNNSISISFPLEIKESKSTIRINNSLTDIKISQTHQYEYSYFDENGDENTSNTVNWQSSDTAIATVNNGLLTAISPGNITITASTVENGTTIISTTTINVSNNILTINDISSLTINESHQYTVTFNGTTPITWESSDNTIATINSSGLVTAISEGTVTIKAKTTEGGTMLTTTTTLEVVGAPSKSGSLSGSYNLSGSVILTSTSLMFTNFICTAPDTHIYLTNNPSSIAGGLKVSTSSVKSNASFSLAVNNININDYGYVVAVCQGAGNLILGSAQLN